MSLSDETSALIGEVNSQEKFRSFLAQINEEYQAVLQLPFTDDSMRKPIKLMGNGQCDLQQLQNLINEYNNAYENLLDKITEELGKRKRSTMGPIEKKRHDKLLKELLIVIPFLDFYFSLDENNKNPWKKLYETATTKDLKNKRGELQQFTNSFQKTIHSQSNSLLEPSREKALGVLKFFIISALKTTLTSKYLKSTDSKNYSDPRDNAYIISFNFNRAYPKLKELYRDYNLVKHNKNAPTQLEQVSPTALTKRKEHPNNPSNWRNQFQCDQYSNGRVFDYLLTLACYMLMLPECFDNNACKLLVAITAIGSVVSAACDLTAPVKTSLPHNNNIIEDYFMPGN